MYIKALRTLKEKLKNIELLTTNDLLETKIPIEAILRHVDLLITDYSSIAIDYLLLEKPLIFLQRKNENYPTIIPKELFPGKIFYSFEAFLNEIKEDTLFEISEKTRKLKSLYHKYDDGNSSKRVWDIILKMLQES